MSQTDTFKPRQHGSPPGPPAVVQRSLEESIMYMVGLISAVVIGGFAAYRWYSGEYRFALINIGIVVTISLPILLCFSHRYHHIAVYLFGVTVTAACLASSFFISNNGLLWALMAIFINSLTLPRSWALALNSLIIISLSTSPQLYLSPLHHVSWATVAILICGFSLMSMKQLRTQRQILATQANFDPLTGVGNRRLMQQHLQDVVHDRRREHSCSTLMVLDIDHFKNINDSQGHEMGDQVLVKITDRIVSSLRSEDDFYRMGGEEFVILFRGMDSATAHRDLPALHGRLSGKVSSTNGPVTFSAGVATLQSDEDWSQWLARADRVLYSAKTKGRNQLRFSDD